MNSNLSKLVCDLLCSSLNLCLVKMKQFQVSKEISRQDKSGRINKQTKKIIYFKKSLSLIATPRIVWFQQE